WELETIVVAMRHDDPADEARGYAPARRVREREIAALGLKADVLRAREIGAEVMSSAGLQCLAVLHHRLDRKRVLRPREALVRRLLAGDDGHGEGTLREGAVDLEHALRLLDRFLRRRVRRVTLLPQELRRAQEEPRPHLPAHDVRPLIEKQRQIAVRADPALE